jgi:hypothetical protein
VLCARVDADNTANRTLTAIETVLNLMAEFLSSISLLTAAVRLEGRALW